MVHSDTGTVLIGILVVMITMQLLALGIFGICCAVMKFHRDLLARMRVWLRVPPRRQYR